MSDKQTIKKETKNAGRAAELAREFPKEVRLAAEAMERAARYRRTLIVEEPRYSYEKIF
jgi:hypothetical protein